MTTRLFGVLYIALAAMGCAGTDPSSTTSSTSESSSSGGGGSGTGGTTGAGGAEPDAGPVPCKTTEDCIKPANPCLSVACDFGTGSGLCKVDPVPSGASCDGGPYDRYPKHTCDGLGSCKLAYAGANCIGASQEPTVANGCDSLNPCVKGTVVNGECSFEISGVGTSCGTEPGLMQCWTGGIDCCPVAPFCTQEGTQAECAQGSVCFQGVCWVSCSSDADCKSTLGPTCGDKTVGNITIKTCM